FLLFTGCVGGITYGHISRKLNSSGLKNTIASSRSSLDLKKILMIAQLTIFCGLLFFSIVFIQQIDYLQNKSLGYNNRNTISFNWPNPYEITSLKESCPTPGRAGRELRSLAPNRELVALGYSFG
ncbi:MAG: hypothetical protein ACLSDJ_12020, partial [Butyricimonas faecihominis]